MNTATHRDQDHLPPPLWRHALAMLYDTLLVVPLFMAAAGLWVAILGLPMPQQDGEASLPVAKPRSRREPHRDRHHVESGGRGKRHP